MKCESMAWDDMRQACRRMDKDYHATRIENALGAGTPDVNACLAGVEHWAELKGMLRWPVVPEDRVIKLDHDLLESQRLWLKARWSAGGNCWVVLGIREPKEWLIWTGYMAAGLIGASTKYQLIRWAAVHHVGPFPTLQFLAAIRDRQNKKS